MSKVIYLLLFIIIANNLSAMPSSFLYMMDKPMVELYYIHRCEIKCLFHCCCNVIKKEYDYYVDKCYNI